MKNTRHGNRISSKIIVLIIVGVLLLSCALFLLYYFEDRNDTFDGQPQETMAPTVEYKGETYAAKEHIETLLIMGVDKFEDDISGEDAYRTSRQADFILLLVIDNDNKRFCTIPVNRDTMTDVNILDAVGEKYDTKVCQIALSHSYGSGKQSCRNTSDAVSQLLSGIEIDNYISLTMDAVPVLNDYVGGVTLTVLDDFSKVDPALVKDETVTLKGSQALTYVRGRTGVGDQTNISRMERQSQYMEKLFELYMNKASESDTFVLSVASEVEKYTVTNSSPSALQDTFEKISAYINDGVLKIEGESVRGEKYMEFYPNRSSLEEIVMTRFYDKKQ